LEALAGPGRFAEHELAESGLRLGPPVPRPGKILCVGLNYRRHAAESGMREPVEPVLFSKFSNSVVGPCDEVCVAGLEQVDYESELAFVIGRRGKAIAESEALSYVLGYLNANDLSERRLQMISGQWLLGKTLDGFLPIGPYLATADEIGDPQSLPIRGWFNGELRQDSSTFDMIFSVAQIIAYASRFMTLEPGDLVCTGTPEGVVLGREDKQWMRPGDSYTVEVGPLGRLTNRLVS
jgi:2-keto-4-pentenoate hydratase/2-oxohepta-3-ene-1,7-dioic acid hydratase in catechol pathway